CTRRRIRDRRTPSRRTLYHSDTPRFIVYAYDYDPDEGEIIGRRVPSIRRLEMTYETVRYESLSGRHVVITGGASGIGAEMVHAFRAQGASIDFLDIDRDAGEAMADETGARFHACDLTDIDALRQTLA